jgi:mannitol/fructose-specific phosphotransferase system IIA component (Ntr-type)
MDKYCCFERNAVKEIESEDRFAAIKELVHKAPALHAVKDLDSFEECVVEREKLQTTACGHGIAFAHGKSEKVDKIIIALGVSKKGIRFDSPDGEPVRLLFVIASSPKSHGEYLAALSTLAKLLANEAFRAKLLNLSHARAVERKLCRAFKDFMQQHRLKTSA